MTITQSFRTLAVIALIALPFMQCGGQQKTAEAPPTMPSAEPPSDQLVDSDAGTAQTPSGIDLELSTGQRAARTQARSAE
jgi:hypothetical protein